MTGRPFFVGLTVIVCVLVTGLALQAEFDAEHTSPPPHRVRPAAATDWTTWAHTDLVFAAQQETDFYEWIRAADQAARDEWIAGVQRAEEEARQAAARGVPRSTPTSASPGACSGVDWVIPVDIIIGESGCNFDAQSPPSFCSGYGCVGAYQFDLRHWTTGACSDLGDWHDPAAQHECARRLSRDGTSLAPWGR